MSGYSFWCTPCGISHAGECPPKPAKAVVKKEPEVEIVVGSRWKGERRSAGGKVWFPAGHPDGYEVMAIISDGTTARSFVQAREWKGAVSVVWTLDIDYWFEDGHYNGNVGCDERMIPWT